MNKKIIGVIVIVAIVVIAIALRVYIVNANTIKIGAMFASNGTNNSRIENGLKGAQLAVKEVNNAGGVLGKQVKLVNLDKINTLIPYVIINSGDEMRASLSTINENKIISVIVDDNLPGLTKDSSYVFRSSPSDSIVIHSITDYALEKKYKNLAVVGTSDFRGEVMKNTFKEYTESAKLKLVSNISVDSQMQNLDEHIGILKEAKPDLVFVALGDESIGKFIEEARSLGLDAVLFYPGNLTYGTTLSKITPKYLKDVMYIVYYPPSLDFTAAYMKEYGIGPGISADTAYDGVKMIVGAIANASSTDPDKVKDSFVSLDGASGLISLDSDHDRSEAIVGFMTFDGKSATPIGVF